MQVFGLDLKDETTVYFDLYFKRQIYRCDNPESSVIVDTLIQPQIMICYFLFPESATEAVFPIQNAEHIALKEGHILRYHLCDQMCWLPTRPAVRTYNTNGNIVSETSCSLTFDNHMKLTRPDNCPGGMECTIIVFRKDAQGMLFQIQNTEYRETDRICTPNFFDYSGWSYIWECMVRGHLYRIGRDIHKIRHYACEQNALYCYLWLSYLGKYTGKWIYEAFAEYIAYTVLLRLTDDGRWMHGFWTQTNETHARMQLDGIQILCYFYQKQGRAIFYEKAVKAMDYLVKMAIPLRKGIWFFHDNLEINEEQRVLYYKQLIKTDAFGKTVSCTLCLNTHIYTITTMEIMSRMVPQEKFKYLIQKGIESLLDVLSSRPMGFGYGLFFRTRDFLLTFQDKPAMRKWVWRYEYVLTHYIVPFLKKRFPRLVMPNGLIERDLCVLHISDHYHLINLRDLLVFYNLYPISDIRQIIIQATKYSFLKGTLKITLKPTSIAGWLLADVLWLYVCLIDSTWIEKMADLLYQFRRKGISIGPLLQSNPVMCNENLILKSDNPKIICLSSPGQDKITAAVFNPDDSLQKTRILCNQRDMEEKMVWLNNSRLVSVSEELTLSPGGYAVLIKKEA